MDMQRFALTEEHLKLLRGMSVSWNYAEFGAPGVDPKRPYDGGASYEELFQGMAKLLGWDPLPDEDDDPDFNGEKVSLLKKLHRETETALQIVLATGSFKPGIYECEMYVGSWAYAGPIPPPPRPTNHRP